MHTCLSILHNDSLTHNTSLKERLLEEEIQLLKLVAYGYVGPGIVVIGIVGNILNLITLLRLSLREVTYVYLSCLAVSDLLTLLFGITSLVRLRDAQPTTWSSAAYFSHVELPVVNALMASSVFLVICVTLVRYFAVCHPTRLILSRNRKWARWTIVGSFTTAFAVYVPVCFEKSIVLMDSMYLSCENPSVVNNAIYQAYLLAKEFVVRLGPVVLLIFLNTSIIYCFCCRRRRLSVRYATTSSFRRKIREEHRLVVLLGAIVVIFVVCVTPASVLTLLHSEEKERHFGFQAFRAVANVLELANYAINFYVYCLCSPDVRTAFRELFTKKHKTRFEIMCNKQESDVLPFNKM